MPFCVHCAKEYKHQTCLIRHERICGITHKGRNRSDDEPLPSVRDLYEVVLHLVEDNKRLKEKVDRLVIKQRQEWSLDEALQGNVPSQTFRQWSKCLVASREHLEYIFQHGRVQGLIQMVTALAKAPNNDLPIRAFKQKKDTVYGYNENGKWEKLSNDDWALFVNTLDKILRVEFTNWQEENTSRLFQPTFQDILVENMQKLNDKRHSNETIKVKQAIYKLISEHYC